MSSHLASQDWYRLKNVADIPSPTLLLYPDRIRENLRRMIAMAGEATKLRPHVKTHKLPQIIAMKLEAGITRFKVATIAEAEMTAAAGGRDILLAYPIVGPNIARFLQLQAMFPTTRFMALVDNLATLDEIDQAAQRLDTVAHLVVDLDVGMHRTGIPPGPHAFALYRSLAARSHLRPAGLHAYDGHLRNHDFHALQKQVDEAFAPVWKLADELEQAGLSVPRIVAGGTPTSALHAHHDKVEVGAGTTVLWDHGQPRMCPEQDYLNAAVLLTRVISRPAPDLLCIDLGYKAVASEMPQPRAFFLDLPDAVPVSHSEEHLVVRTDQAPEFPPGTPLYAIPWHICPTLALHQAAWVVENQRATNCWPIVARNRKINV